VTPRSASLSLQRAYERGPGRRLEAQRRSVSGLAVTDGDEGESGRGLVLVEALAVRWGWAPRRPLGKTVWAEVSVGVPGSRC
jgi:hypothetical protein